MKVETLNAESLKNKLWETLNEIRGGIVDPKTANAIAAQARGIISTIKVEIQIQNAAALLSKNVLGFTDLKKGKNES